MSKQNKLEIYKSNLRSHEWNKNEINATNNKLKTVKTKLIKQASVKRSQKCIQTEEVRKKQKEISLPQTAIKQKSRSKKRKGFGVDKKLNAGPNANMIYYSAK